MARHPYPSDLTDREWRILEPLVPLAKQGGRPRKHPLRDILDAIFYVDRSGCSWRMLPHEFPPWKTVYHYFRQFRLDGTWKRMQDELRRMARMAAGRSPEPTAAILDSQSIRTSQRGGPRGYDGAKKISGRKRHLLVDTLGLPLLIKVLPANISDRDGGEDVLLEAKQAIPPLRHLFVDQGYRGQWVKWVEGEVGWTVEVVARPRKIRGIWWPKDQPLPDWYFEALEEQKKFKVIPRRWVVERSFAWYSFHRRLVRDYEFLPETTEAFLQVAATHLLVRRLAA
ncbi:IS5 family transposase [Deinococcus yavapaiensis]|uniref:Putative transposase n=1 Tax=Deinococcus yavapaiensis KR-236 TaxID=694435 RepID=A0A318S4U6_9DEIO|nr:IS5 family transposase [Deinococcus yavapaiensis]PYE53633.1 putative transposase [Deinococcus yavapaiensis KR-236]